MKIALDPLEPVLRTLLMTSDTLGVLLLDELKSHLKKALIEYFPFPETQSKLQNDLP